tara:strand:+ start:1398 stop:1823 length:426 start_codon:yes stop_codon:yes gene_type:complete
MKYPKFLKFNTGICLVRITPDTEHPAIYYRHGGEYYITVNHVGGGRFFSDKDSVKGISVKRMYPTSLDEWSESNGQYATSEYVKVHTCKMKRTDWNKYENNTGRIKATVQYKNGSWVIVKCGISNLLDRELEPITKELYLK